MFRLDPLAVVMLTLITLLSLVIGSFAYRYLSGDRLRGRMLALGAALSIGLGAMVSAQHLLVFAALWAYNNTLLILLMRYKSEWRAARAASWLAAVQLGLGSAVLALACTWLWADPSAPVLSLIMFAAICQSALWPQHRWLLSSLNSPTPVSALMHAGLVNGGCFLLLRFSDFLEKEPLMAAALVLIGLFSFLVGSFWALIQNDIKRQLACSTMAQMGFSLLQCGLGLYPAALAHICWHGCSKAYFFLNTGGAARVTRWPTYHKPAVSLLAKALLCGLLTASLFSAITAETVLPLDSRLVLHAVACIAGTQAALSILGGNQGRLMRALIFCVAFGGAYGISVLGIEVLGPKQWAVAQPLGVLHLFVILAITGAWLSHLYGTISPRLWYWGFRASQPAPATVTAERNSYAM